MSTSSNILTHFKYSSTCLYFPSELYNVPRWLLKEKAIFGFFSSTTSLILKQFIISYTLLPVNDINFRGLRKH
jgi:hypothetical protein